MVASRLIARLGLIATIVCLSVFVVVIAIGSSKFSARDLKAHGTALFGQPAEIRNTLSGALAVTHR